MRYLTNRGITVLELLLALTLLALLAGVATLAAVNTIEQPKRMAHLNNAKAVESVLIRMYAYGEFSSMMTSSTPQTQEYTLEQLVADGHLHPLKYPKRGGAYAADSKAVVTCTAQGCTYNIILKEQGATDWYILDQASAYTGFSAADDFSCLVLSGDGGLDFIAADKKRYDKIRATRFTKKCDHRP